MAQIILGIFLVLYGLNAIVGLALPLWVLGTVALIAGVLILAERLGITVRKK